MGGETTGRFVQMMRFRDRKHQLAVQTAERQDQAAQDLIAEFCELINFPYQQQQGLFAVGFYQSVLPVTPSRLAPADVEPAESAENETMDANSAVGVAADPAGLRMVEEDTADAASGNSEPHDDTPDGAANDEPVEVTEISDLPEVGEPPHPSH